MIFKGALNRSTVIKISGNFTTDLEKNKKKPV